MDTYKLFTYKNIQNTLFYPRLKVNLSDRYSDHLRFCLKLKALTCTVRAARLWLCTLIIIVNPKPRLTYCPSKSVMPSELYMASIFATYPGHASFPCTSACPVLNLPTLLRFDISFLGKACHKTLDICLAQTPQRPLLSPRFFFLCISQCGVSIPNCLSKYTTTMIHNSFVHSGVQ